jgi:DNA-binding NtrC family response regulator
LPEPLILMVDNHPEFLDTRAEHMEQAGYHVLKAGSTAAARLSAGEAHPELSIVDVRLLNDDDVGDYTGVHLAEFLRETCPVIILTDHATFDVVRKTLTQDETGRLFPVDFVDKHEGPEVLIQAVRRTLRSTQKLQKRGKINRRTWRVIRIVAFSMLSLTLIGMVLLARNSDKAVLVLGTIFAALQFLVGIASLFFDRPA